METGYKAFRIDVLRSLELTEDSFGIEPEIHRPGLQAQLRIYELRSLLRPHLRRGQEDHLARWLPRRVVLFRVRLSK